MKLSAEALKSDLRGFMKIFRELAKGHISPGSGSKYLSGTKVSYARTTSGARVFFIQTDEGIQIVGTAVKKNEDEVIKQIEKIYGK